MSMRSGVARNEDIAYRAAQTALAAAGPGWTMAISFRPYAPAGRQWHWELIRQEGEAA